MNKIAVIVLAGLACALAMLFIGGILHGLKQWRRCEKCRWFYDTEGVTVPTLPNGTPEPITDGQCPDCKSKRN